MTGMTSMTVRSITNTLTDEYIGLHIVSVVEFDQQQVHDVVGHEAQAKHRHRNSGTRQLRTRKPANSATWHVSQGNFFLETFQDTLANTYQLCKQLSVWQSCVV